MRRLLVAIYAAVFLLAADAPSKVPKARRPSSGDGPAGAADGGSAASFAGSGLIGGPSLAPPARAGTARFKVEGCAANPERAMEQPPPSRALPPSDSRPNVQPIPGGALIVHEVAHACCLKAKVTSHVGKGIATVRETLSGRPCRCMCSSTLRTALALVPGAYQLIVELEQGKRVERVYEQALSTR